MTTTDDDARLEQAIRAGLAARDPGPAPAWLRVRVAAAATRSQSGRGRVHRLIGMTRSPAAAVLTLAAALFGVLLVAVMRSRAARPGGPGPTTGPGSPGAGVDLATVSRPLALPIGSTIIVALIGLLVAWAAVEVYLRTPRARPVALGRLRGKRARGVVVVLLAVPILFLGQFVQRDESIVQGSHFQASLVHLEGMGTRQPWIRQTGNVAYFRYVPGATVTFVQAVRNAGRFPITVLGGRSELDDLELRLFAVHDPTGPVDVDTMPTYPFAPFALAPGEEREIVVVAHFGPCPGIPTPSVEPSPDLSGDYQPPSGAAVTGTEFDSIGLAYSVLGFVRETEVPTIATVIVQSPTDSMCGGDPYWATPSAAPSAP